MPRVTSLCLAVLFFPLMNALASEPTPSAGEARLVSAELSAVPLLCQPGACKPIESTKGLPNAPESSTHQVQLQKNGPWIETACSSASDSVCYFGGWDNGVGIPGDSFTIPGDGCIYGRLENNSAFPRKGKYCLTEKGTLREVPQHYRHVGLATKANVRLELFASLDAKAPFHVILPGSFVEVLLALEDTPAGTHESGRHTPYATAPERFIVRDELGISGVVTVKILPCPQFNESSQAAIEGLCARGD